MAEPAFTPGPWTAGQFRDCSFADGFDIGAANNSNVALVHFDARDHELREARANAHLIAAAPDLYAALRILIEDNRFDLMVGGNPKATSDLFYQCRAALAKARGEASE